MGPRAPVACEVVRPGLSQYDDRPGLATRVSKGTLEEETDEYGTRGVGSKVVGFPRYGGRASVRRSSRATKGNGMTANWRRLWFFTLYSLALAMLVLLALATSAGADPGAILFRATANPDRGARQPTIGSCTMAVPPRRATVEAEIANAADFCELVSHPLAGDVFRAPVIVTPGLLWHYPDSTLSCRLRYGDTRYRLTIRNSPAACRWLSRLAPGWHREVPRASNDPRPSRPIPESARTATRATRRDRVGRDVPNAGQGTASRSRR